MIAAAAVAVSVLLAGLAVFQVALVAGAPLGRFAWGGQADVLPTALRIGSVVSVVLYGVIAWVVWRAVGRPGDGWIWVVTAYFALGVVLNAISRSRPERLVMTPVVLVLAGLCLLIALGQDAAS
ncbi:hypothetical protein E4P40_22455 [Blastococcus sp. CT_GayMR20]|uniref:hypothetical protein n=1 Tax=Blastococcus sp. CT_GayMR20 TaxID=2559609 RepID=UPI00107334BE|nr:hypothetical protein [Blastococcus sp. CT_GayMR20]TFV69182.1 hypothetical protein E4P40_22455 [Blastococcus sp. CT_GayMR20]